jgi:hypothetical protein
VGMACACCACASTPGGAYCGALALSSFSEGTFCIPCVMCSYLLSSVCTSTRLGGCGLAAAVNAFMAMICGCSKYGLAAYAAA